MISCAPWLFWRKNRRRFLGAVPALLAGGAAQGAEPEPNVLGPLPGYSPRVGSLVSELGWMRRKVLSSIGQTTPEQLDFLTDPKANRIGALLLHLAATERLYQLNTFEGIGIDAVEKSPAFKEWKTAMDLGEPARQAIKGQPLEYYLKALREVRERTLQELQKRNDRWLAVVDKQWPWGPTNNHCKWFHVCEHESHHLGQIAFLQARAPGGSKE